MITELVDLNYNIYDTLLTRKDLFKTKVVLCVINYFLEGYGYIMLQNKNPICADMQSQNGPQDQNRTFT